MQIDFCRKIGAYKFLQKNEQKVKQSMPNLSAARTFKFGLHHFEANKGFTVWNHLEFKAMVSLFNYCMLRSFFFTSKKQTTPEQDPFSLVLCQFQLAKDSSKGLFLILDTSIFSRVTMVESAGTSVLCFWESFFVVGC